MFRKHSRAVNVLVVDDSAVVGEALSAILSLEPDISVATAPDPVVAIAKMAHRRR
jgi:chemotaxis response regulator CheB